MSLKLGQMGSPADPPNAIPAAFQNSLAANIELAFNTLLQAEGLPGLQLDSNTSEVRDRRMLFVAIAQGLGCFLANNASALTLSPPIPGETITLDLADPLL